MAVNAAHAAVCDADDARRQRAARCALATPSHIICAPSAQVFESFHVKPLSLLEDRDGMATKDNSHKVFQSLLTDHAPVPALVHALWQPSAAQTPPGRHDFSRQERRANPAIEAVLVSGALERQEPRWSHSWGAPM